jgi:uncharacterized membrane protein
VVAGVLNLAALAGRRPSEIALLFGLVRIARRRRRRRVALTLVFGLWLVHEAPWRYSYGEGWIVAALVLWVLGNVAGNLGGRRDERTAKLARALAMKGDVPSPELRARVRAPVSLALSYGSGLVMLAVLGLMIWNPGVG